MITKIMGEAPFQVLTNNFSISPSNEGYTLQISADGKNFSNLFQVGANVTRLVTGVAANSYYRLLGNDSEVLINWMKTCVTEGGGSGSGVTPEEVQAQIDSALTPFWDSADTKDYVDEAISGVSIVLSDFYTSAQTESAITMAVSGKADAVSVSGNTNRARFPKWNEQGIITGAYGNAAYEVDHKINGSDYWIFRGASSDNLPSIYAPTKAGTAGDILVSNGGGAPVWSAVTFPDVSNYVTSAQVETQILEKNYITSAYTGFTPIDDFNFISGRVQTNEQVVSEALNDLNDRIEEISGSTPTIDLSAYTPTSGFATINGSAITNGGNLVISAGTDMSAYWTSAQTTTWVNNQLNPISGQVSELRDDFEIMDEVVADALNDLNANLATKVGSESVTTIWKGTQQEYDTIVNPDSSTLYIIID